MYFSVNTGITLEQGKRPYMEDRAEVKLLEPFPSVLPNYKAAFIGVYDGHGGSTSVEYIVNNLRAKVVEVWNRLLLDYLRVDPEFDESKPIDNNSPKRIGVEKLTLIILPTAIAKAFKKIDKELFNLWKTKSTEDDGSTVVIGIIVYNKLIVAHCGDSRATLCRGGVAVELTKDHKPHFANEKARIEQTGGQVIRCGSVHRVNGILAIGRSLGDFLLKVFI